MVGILIKVVVGLALFVGSLVGGLAATGRLNHEGTANIPVLSTFFPAPEADESAADDGDHAEASTDSHGAPTDAAHDANDESGPQGQDRPRVKKVGRSYDNPEEPKSDGHGGHGGDGHGDGGHGDGGHDDGGHATSSHAPAPKRSGGAHPQKREGHEDDEVQRDFAAIEAAQGRTGYRPGALFHFEGMPSGVTPEQLNAAWASVKAERKELEQREHSLDLRDQRLQELADDISHRQADLGKLQLDIEAMEKQLNEQIARFESTVILVKDEEVAKLKANGKTMASFEPAKAGEIIQQQWSSERGQREIVKLLRFMEADEVNDILAELPNPLVQDILEKRMQVSKTASPPAGRD